jgi:ribosomal protein S25
MIWVKAKPERLASNNKKKEKPKEEEADEEERQISEKIIEEVDDEVKMGSIYDNEGDAERKNLIQELVEENE